MDSDTNSPVWFDEVRAPDGTIYEVSTRTRTLMGYETVVFGSALAPILVSDRPSEDAALEVHTAYLLMIEAGQFPREEQTGD
jgi:hypothetical protein